MKTRILWDTIQLTERKKEEGRKKKEKKERGREDTIQLTTKTSHDRLAFRSRPSSILNLGLVWELMSSSPFVKGGIQITSQTTES